MQKLYTIFNTETHESMRLALPDILAEINRDRSEDWQPYDESDWREGLAEFCYPLMLVEKERVQNG